MSSNTINMLIRATLGVLAAILITGITLHGPAFATHRRVGEAEKWTPSGEFYGELKTDFADIVGVDGVADHKADLIMVNEDGIWVRMANKEGTGFMGKDKITTGKFYGPRGTFFADVTGDGLADPIAIFDDQIQVRVAVNGQVQRVTSTGRYYGDVGTFFSNVDDRRIRQSPMAPADISDKLGTADLITIDWVNRSERKAKVTVRRSDGQGHFGVAEDWTWTKEYFTPGTLGTFMADVTGDNLADLIAVNREDEENKGIRVSPAWFDKSPSSPSKFFPPEAWTKEPVPFFYGTLANGSQATFFADVTWLTSEEKRDNRAPRADAIGLNDGMRIIGDDGIGVRETVNDGRGGQQFATPTLGTVPGFPRCGPDYYVTHEDAPRLGADGCPRAWGYWTKDGTGETFYGTRGTFFADVTGDGTADAIAVNDDGVLVRRSCVSDGFSCAR
jgi:hypothetical protein